MGEMSIDLSVALIVAVCTVIAVPSSLYAVSVSRRTIRDHDIASITRTVISADAFNIAVDTRAANLLSDAITEEHVVSGNAYRADQRWLKRELDQFRSDVTDRFDRLDRAVREER
jgi:hypothetical protein